MDVQPIVDAVHHLSTLQTPARNSAGHLHLASVDPITASNWTRECGEKLGRTAWMAYARKKLQSGEFSKFVVNKKAI